MLLRYSTRLLLSLVIGISLFVGNSVAQRGKEKSKDGAETKKTEPVKVGDDAPDFEIETFEDKKIKLSERFGEDGKPVVLLFSRAHW